MQRYKENIIQLLYEIDEDEKNQIFLKRIYTIIYLHILGREL